MEIKVENLGYPQFKTQGLVKLIKESNDFSDFHSTSSNLIILF